MTKLGNTLLSLTLFSMRTVWTKVLLSWESHFFYIIQNLPNTLKVAKSTFLFCGVDSNVPLGPMDIGVFPCKHTLWQYFFQVNLKTLHSITILLKYMLFFQPPLENSKQMSNLLYCFLSFKMCSTGFTETFLFKLPFSMSQCSHS